MKTNEELKVTGCTSIEELITEDFGAVGTPERDEFERRCEAFIINEQLSLLKNKDNYYQGSENNIYL